jgi:hypothetical protein
MPTSAARTLAALLALAGAAPAAAQSKGAAPAPPRPAAAPAQPSQAAAPAPAAPESDGEAAMGSWAAVVFNTREFDFPQSGGAAPLPLTVYTLGVRHWTTRALGPFRNWGVDAGIGFTRVSSSVTQPQTGTLVTSDGPRTSGFGLHAGLPLAIRHHRHATFELVPEVDLIYAKEKIPAQAVGGDATEYDGWSLRLGARAGLEIFFGFIGLPELAIEAGLGAAVSYDTVTSKVGPLERTTRRWGFATVRGTEPWSIFTGSVAAMYHF